MKKSALLVSVSCLAFALISLPVAAKDLGDSYLSKERFQVRARVLGVVPNDGEGSVNIGGESDVGDAVTPEVDLTYFLTENVAFELIAATAQHRITYNDTTSLGTVWILPPTLTAQYHFQPDEAFSPYVGTGINYSLFYGEDTGNGFTNLEVDGGVGFALQAGFDYWLDDNWGVNFDVKKLWLDIDGKLNNGAITTDIDLDPVIVGAGISYRF